MAISFKSITIDATVWTAPSPIEAIPANQAAIESFINSLGFGTFSVLVTIDTLLISIIQCPYTVLRYTVVRADGDFNVPMLNTNCMDLETDDAYYCDYQLQAVSDASDVLTGIVVDSVLYQPPTELAANDVVAINAWLLTQGLGYIQYNNTGGFYIVALQTNHNISYIRIVRNGDTTIVINFSQTNCVIPVLGCTNRLADNYNSQATIDDGTCVFGTKKYGCTDPKALNYDPTAEILDDSCLYGPISPLDKLKCCLGEMVYKLSVAQLNGDPVSCCLESKIDVIESAIEALESFQPDSENTRTETIPGYVANATINLEPFPEPARVTGIVTVNGITIAVLPETLCTTDQEFVDLIVGMVTSGGSAYSIEDNADLTVTLKAASPTMGANGFVINIILNPEMALINSIENDGLRGAQLLSIKDVRSPLYGKTYLACGNGSGLYFMSEIVNQVVTQQILIPNGTLPNPFTTPGCSALAWDDFNRKIYISGMVPIGKWIYMNEDYTFMSQTPTPFPNIDPSGPSPVLGMFRAAYNSVNRCKYFVGYNTPFPQGNCYKLTETDIMTALSLGSLSNLNSNPVNLAIDELSGNIWVIGKDYMWIIAPDTHTVLTEIDNAGFEGADITYYPGDGSANSERMFVAYKSGGIVKNFRLDGAEDNSSFHDSGSDLFDTSVFYSTIFNLIFIGTGDTVFVYKMNGTLYQTITDCAAMEFDDNIKEGIVIGASQIFTPDRATLWFFGYVNTGTPTFTATMEGEVPETVVITRLREDDPCLTVTQIELIEKKGLELCEGCCGTEEKIVSDEIPPN